MVPALDPGGEGRFPAGAGRPAQVDVTAGTELRGDLQVAAFRVSVVSPTIAKTASPAFAATVSCSEYIPTWRKRTGFACSGRLAVGVLALFGDLRASVPPSRVTRGH